MSKREVPVIVDGQKKVVHDVEVQEAWIHGKGCDCVHCTKAAVPYIVLDNGDDFVDVDVPNELEDELIWQAQDGREFYLRRIK